MTNYQNRKVELRNQKLDSGIRSALDAWIDRLGDLHLDGQDLGLPPGMMGHDDEYEYFKTIAASDVPALVTLLGGEPGEEVLDLLARDWTGDRSFALERLLRDKAPFRIQFHSC